MDRLTRRNFLKTGAVLTASAFASPSILRAESLSDRVRVGFVGTGPMGRSDCQCFSRICDLVALCDLDEKYGLAPAKNNGNINRLNPDTYSDYRRILDRKDIDLVGIATPDHWHSKIAVEALLAGKHVFCEKPLTLTVEEGTLIRNACKKSGKVFQVGTMQRVSKLFQTAVLIVQKGFLGDIKQVVCHIDGGLVSPPIPKAEVPATLDWNLWQGQAPLHDYVATAEMHPNFGCPLHTRGHHEFRWFFDYAGGKFTDWGAHHVDIALWALNQNAPGQGPEKFNPVIAEHPVPMKGGYPLVHDQYQTATKFQVDCQMPDGINLQLVSHSPNSCGVLFEGTQGSIHVSRGRIKGNVYENEKVQDSFTEEDYLSLSKGKKLDWNLGDLDRHKQNMVDCIKEGGLPISDLDSHVQEINLCHVACIATRLGRELAWDAKTETFVNDKEANSFLAREQRKGFEIPR
ncbi:MAG: Gfo/Idh/MocA family oxidoreductase [Planctomycetaceae bacterium]|nr:Gfo/Idh/MocA family oxidoreductase [Planctomycetaceae bacterium]